MGVYAVTDIGQCDVSIGGSKYGLSIGRSGGISEGKSIQSNLWK